MSADIPLPLIARALIVSHGAEAGARAMELASEARDAGDHDSADVWVEVAKTVGEDVVFS